MMNLEIFVNDYLLAWYILYGASLSREIDKFKKDLKTVIKKTKLNLRRKLDVIKVFIHLWHNYYRLVI